MSRYWVPENYEDEVGEYHPPDYDYCNKYGCELEFKHFSAWTTSRGKQIATLTAYCDVCGRDSRFKNFGRVIQ